MSPETVLQSFSNLERLQTNFAARQTEFDRAHSDAVRAVERLRETMDQAKALGEWLVSYDGINPKPLAAWLKKRGVEVTPILLICLVHELLRELMVQQTEPARERRHADNRAVRADALSRFQTMRAKNPKLSKAQAAEQIAPEIGRTVETVRGWFMEKPTKS